MDIQERGKMTLMNTFREQLVSFLDELIEQFPEESNLFLARIFIKDQAPVYDVLGRFIRDILPMKPCVDERDTNFFLETDLFVTKYKAPGESVSKFRDLWLSPTLDDSDREVIWSWVDVLLKVAQQYYETHGDIPGWEREV
jgi:hypothetical protein